MALVHCFIPVQRGRQRTRLAEVEAGKGRGRGRWVEAGKGRGRGRWVEAEAGKYDNLCEHGEYVEHQSDKNHHPRHAAECLHKGLTPHRHEKTTLGYDITSL